MAVLAVAWPMAAQSVSLAPYGCPMFHCNAEATEVMPQPVVQTVPVLTANNSLGLMKAQGCAGDGARLACIYYSDALTGLGKGTLKLIDAATLQPIWGSATAPNSRDLDPASAAGQAPVVFADGRVAAGDASVHVLYDANGAVLGSVPLLGKGNNLGLTPLTDTFGVVSQSDGVLTVVNLSTWQGVGSFMLRDPVTQARISLVSPSAGTGNRLYAVGINNTTNGGWLFSLAIDPRAHALSVKATYGFVGHSGISPVVLTPALTGRGSNLILLHAPALLTDTLPQDRLVALSDNTTTLAPAWTLGLDTGLAVTPTVDQGSQTLFFQYMGDRYLHQVRLADGAPVAVFDLRAISQLPGALALNGHVASSQAGGVFTLFLSANVVAVGGWTGQYVMAFTPNATPGALLWAKRLSRTADSYTAAWNLSPSVLSGLACPIVVGTGSGLSRLCDAP
jgi:hypothetical protein